MAEVRCPMCSKPNSEDAEVCEFCGARIKPLLANQDAGEIRDKVSPADVAKDISSDDLDDDWLSRMRGETESGEEAIDEAVPADLARGSTDLLGRLEGLGLSATAKDSSAQDNIAAESFDEHIGNVEEKPAVEPFEEHFEAPAEALDETSRAPFADDSKAQEETLAEPREEEKHMGEVAVPDWLSRIRDRRQKDSELIEEDLAAEALVEGSVKDAESFEQAIESDEKQFSESDFEHTEKGITKGGLSWNFIEDDDAEPFDFRSRSPEDSSVVELNDELESSLEGEEQVPQDVHKPDDLKVAPFDPGTADDLLAELGSSSGIEELLRESEESIEEDQTLAENLSSLEVLFDEFGPEQDAEDLFGEPAEPSLDEEEVDVSPALENLIADLERSSDAQPDQEHPEIVEDEASFDGLYKAFGQGGDTSDIFSEAEHPSDLDPDSADLEDLFAELQGSEEDDSLKSSEYDHLFEEESAEDGGDDLFADLNRTLDEGELLSAAQGLPPELQGDEFGDESDFEAMASEEVDLASEPEPEFLVEDSIKTMEGGEEDNADSLIDSDFLADLGIDIDEAEQPADSRLTEQMFEPPTTDEIAIERDEAIDADLESETDDVVTEADPLANFLLEDNQVEEVSSLPPFQFADIEPSQIDDELGGFSPSWLNDESVEEINEGAEHVPALVLGEDGTTGEEFGQQPLAADIPVDEMPGWLQDLGADIADEEFEEEEPDQPGLTRATLPPWLEAMRPIETFQTRPELELEEEEVEEIVEAAGPLAGLRGVLLAEPVIAMPRSASAGVSALDISELHYSHTEILRQMVGEEELELARPEITDLPYPIVRWICAALLVLAVALPTILGFPTFKEPRLAPRSLNLFLEVVNTTPPEKPALMIFDYEPGYSGEMDAVAGALVENLFARNQAIVTLSTRPSGPLLADRMLLRTGTKFAIENGEDYFHLGYLSGGPAAIQLFAGSPRRSLVSGFRLPEDFENEQPWSAEILSDVNQVSDFSIVAVLTSGTENARMWAEQLSPQLDATPLVFVTTAGAEPLIRPYFESETPQIDGILTGLQSALKYEVWNAQLSDASKRWNSFGMGILAAELVLLSGLILGSAKWLIKQGILVRD